MSGSLLRLQESSVLRASLTLGGSRTGLAAGAATAKFLGSASTVGPGSRPISPSVVAETVSTFGPLLGSSTVQDAVQFLSGQATLPVLPPTDQVSSRAR